MFPNTKLSKAFKYCQRQVHQVSQKRLKHAKILLKSRAIYKEVYNIDPSSNAAFQQSMEEIDLYETIGDDAFSKSQTLDRTQRKSSTKSALDTNFFVLPKINENNGSSGSRHTSTRLSTSMDPDFQQQKEQVYKHMGPFAQIKYRHQFIVEDMKKFLGMYNTNYSSTMKPRGGDERSKSVLSSAGNQFMRPQILNQSSNR